MGIKLEIPGNFNREVFTLRSTGMMNKGRSESVVNVIQVEVLSE